MPLILILILELEGPIRDGSLLCLVTMNLLGTNTNTCTNTYLNTDAYTNDNNTIISTHTNSNTIT